MYGLPKIHKPNIKLRPILSLIGSAQHKLAKWLSEVLDPVLKKYSKHCIKDSLTFAEFMQNLNIQNETSFMCSLDISSLFTNVPLSETIKICADALYRNELNSPPFPEEVFIILMETATHSVEFCFNNEMYQQKDGVAMGSPLGPALANIFVGFHEERFFDYERYVDDTYTNFKTEAEPSSLCLKRKKMIPCHFRCFGRKVLHWISYQCISQAYFHWSVHTLEFI